MSRQINDETIPK